MNHVSGMISAVLARPKMYTILGTYEEVVAFLDGYYSGAGISSPLEPSVGIWGGFTEYLSSLLNSPSSKVFHELQTRHGRDALNELGRLYKEFADQ